MKRFVLYFCGGAISISFAFASACSIAPEYKAAVRGVSYSGDASGETCLSGKNFSAKEGSFISWHATKITAMGSLVPLTGTNSIQGNLNIKNNSWSEASSTINFVSKSTNSEDPIRDSRIKSFVFGEPDGLAFQFKLEEIVGDNLEMEEGASKNALVKGTLLVGNQTTNIEMPALIKEISGLITITPMEVYKLNVRSVSPVVNGVNLVDQIAHLLTFVPGVDMQDEVMIDFNLEFKPSCL